MIREEIKKIKSGPRDLRNFGLTMAVAFLLIGLYFMWRGRFGWSICFGLAAFFGVFGVLFPTSLKPLQKVWMVFAILLGYVMTHLILVVMFYLVFTPIGLVARLFGHRPLDLGWDPEGRKSYWQLREQPAEVDSRQYEKQY
jgi:hypothetical protein